MVELSGNDKEQCHLVMRNQATKEIKEQNVFSTFTDKSLPGYQSSHM